MEPVSSVVGTIFKLLQEIAKAEMTARRKRTRCRELARRAEVVGNVLRASKAGARGDAAPTRMSILSRLRKALDDRLKLVESCSRSGGLVSRLLTSGARAARFDDVDKRITTCLVDLAAANGVSVESKIDQLAARDRHPRTNKPVSGRTDGSFACAPSCLTLIVLSSIVRRSRSRSTRETRRRKVAPGTIGTVDRARAGRTGDGQQTEKREEGGRRGPGAAASLPRRRSLLPQRPWLRLRCPSPLH
ncbi:hypothetical protein C2845_PM17G09090 [Panicum miliaceum]|uniref:DUF7792 domain-containing protein n=1 Tax=Panicum miliaceum TaxID=4540 RepID=A0A3L6Q1Y6_PANMI|nr:hypothetical protein C2845_PM17G09090 [Panicum miliaceum]